MSFRNVGANIFKDYYAYNPISQNNYNKNQQNQQILSSNDILINSKNSSLKASRISNNQSNKYTLLNKNKYQNTSSLSKYQDTQRLSSIKQKNKNNGMLMKDVNYFMIEQINNQGEYKPIKQQNSIFIDDNGKQITINPQKIQYFKQPIIEKLQESKEFYNNNIQQISTKQLDHILLLMIAYQGQNIKNNSKFNKIMRNNSQKIQGLVNFVHQNQNNQQFLYLKDLMTDIFFKQKYPKSKSIKKEAVYLQKIDQLTQIKDILSDIEKSNLFLQNQNLKSSPIGQTYQKINNRLEKQSSTTVKADKLSQMLAQYAV